MDKLPASKYYKFTTLFPLSVTVDEDGDTHAVYQLPQPVIWNYKHSLYGSDNKPLATFLQRISKIRVCVTLLDCPYHKPAVIVVPIDEEEQESPINALVLHSAISVAAAMKRLGFEPLVNLN